MFKQIMAFGLAIVGAGMFAAQPVFADTTTTSGNITTTISGSKLSSAATTDAQVTLTPGGLLITQAPNIEFGSQQIMATGKTYPATKVSPTLSVLNAGQDTDWSVQLTVGTFQNTAGTRMLKGVTLSLNNTSVAASGGVVSQAPTGMSATIAANGSSKTILSADRSKIDQSQYSTLGVGVWWSYYNASLYVPAGNVQGDYKSTLTWTLNNAPQ